MAEPLGRALYRGLLKAGAHVWKPQEVRDAAALHRLLAHMQAAQRGLRRLQAALEENGAVPLAAILQSLGLTALDQVNSLETLEKIVLALEAKRK